MGGRGKVWLVGAGPGDKAMITQRGRWALARAQAVVFDRLAGRELLLLAPDDCELVDVGKRDSHHLLPQDQINNLLATLARQGKNVVRLKGGDPCLFGRGGEEAGWLEECGIDYEIVPGISSAIGGLEYAGIPATHRGMASSFHVYTAHFESQAKELDYEAIVAAGGTSVFLMGLRVLGEISHGLVAAGLPGQTPVALISNASLPSQKTTFCSVETVEEHIKGMESPCLMVVGEVAAYQKKLRQTRRLPSVLLTGGENFNRRISEVLDEEDIPYSICPVNQLRVLDTDEGMVDRLLRGSYSHVAFTSPTATRVFFGMLMEAGHDLRLLSGVHISAIGEGTAQTIRKYGVRPDFVSTASNGAGFADDMIMRTDGTSRILLPVASFTRRRFQERMAGVRDVHEVAVYSMETAYQNKRKLEYAVEAAGAVAFLSVGAIRSFFELYERQLPEEVVCLAMGEAEVEELKRMGYENIMGAARPNLPGVVATCREYRSGMRCHEG